MYQQRRYLPFEARKQQFVARSSCLSTEDDDDHIHTFLSLPDSFPFEEDNKSLVRKRNSLTQSKHSLVKPSIESFSLLSVLQDLFASRSVFGNGEHSAIMPEDMTISWTRSDEDSDISTVPGVVHDWETLSDHDESEEDTFCVETILRRRVPASDEEAVLVSFSTVGTME